MRMHAVIQSADPPIRYLSPTSIAIFDAVAALRDAGVESYATANAGPNIAVISRPEDAQTVADALAEYGNVWIAGAGRRSKNRLTSPRLRAPICSRLAPPAAFCCRWNTRSLKLGEPAVLVAVDRFLSLRLIERENASLAATSTHAACSDPDS